jgi:hypothetical protein
MKSVKRAYSLPTREKQRRGPKTDNEGYQPHRLQAGSDIFLSADVQGFRRRHRSLGKDSAFTEAVKGICEAKAR